MQRSFYLVMMTLISALILFGFSHTIGSVVLYPDEPPPAMLYVHVAIFCGWLVVLLTQTILIATSNPRLHRRLGWFGLGFATLMVAVGLATTVVMGHWQVQRDGPAGCMFIYRPFEDILFFAVAFGLAIHWRKRPDFHRRLMLLAAVSVTPPAISRIPGIHPLSVVYGTADLLIVAAIIHDWMTIRHLHTVYRWACPIIAIGQVALLAVLSLRPAPFFHLALAITR